MVSSASRIAAQVDRWPGRPGRWAVGDEPEDGRGGDQGGDAGGREPVAGVQGSPRSRSAQPLVRIHGCAVLVVAAGQEQGGQAQLGEGLLGDVVVLGGHLALGADRGGFGDPGIVHAAADGSPRRPVRRCGGSASATAMYRMPFSST